MQVKLCDPCLSALCVKLIVSWSLTSLVSTNMAISETRALCVYLGAKRRYIHTLPFLSFPFLSLRLRHCWSRRTGCKTATTARPRVNDVPRSVIQFRIRPEDDPVLGRAGRETSQLDRSVGNWTTRGYANSRIANSRTGQVADWTTRGLAKKEN